MKWRLKQQYKDSINQWIVFWKYKQIDKHLAKLTKRKEEKTQTDKVRDEKREVTTCSNWNQIVSKQFFRNIYSHKLENLEYIDSRCI